MEPLDAGGTWNGRLVLSQVKQFQFEFEGTSMWNVEDVPSTFLRRSFDVPSVFRWNVEDVPSTFLRRSFDVVFGNYCILSFCYNIISSKMALVYVTKTECSDNSVHNTAMLSQVKWL